MLSGVLVDAYRATTTGGSSRQSIRNFSVWNWNCIQLLFNCILCVYYLPNKQKQKTPKENKTFRTNQNST